MYSLFQCSLYVALSLSALTTAAFVDPYPVSDCSQGIAFGYATCPTQPGCCAGGAACCAGGCCPITAWCVNQGTSDEGCCPLSDNTYCGASVASYSQPACTGSGPPKPSVQCVSVDDDWYCPPGSVCGAVKPGCINFGVVGCTAEASDDMSSATETPDPSTSDDDSSVTATPDPSESGAAGSLESGLSAVGTGSTGASSGTPAAATSHPGTAVTLSLPSMSMIVGLGLLLVLIM